MSSTLYIECSVYFLWNCASDSLLIRGPAEADTRMCKTRLEGCFNKAENILSENLHLTGAASNDEPFLLRWLKADIHNQILYLR